MTVEQVPIDSVTEHPQNARRGDVDAIATSLQIHGQYAPIVVQKSTGHVLKGNHTLRAARELAWDTIAAVFVDVDDDRATRIMLIDNATSDVSDYDAPALQELIDQLEGDLQGTGYDEASIDELLRTLVGELPKVEHVPIRTLRPHPRNYQTHSPEQLTQIAASIQEHGFYRAVVVAEDDTILAGHGVVLAALQLDLPLIPVIRLPVPPDDPRAIRVMTGDNELNNMAEVDDRALTELLRELYGEGGDQALLGTGFDATQLAAMSFTTRSRSEFDSADEAAEWVGMPDYQPNIKIPILHIQFESKEARQVFVSEHGLGNAHKMDSGKTIWSVTWPPRAAPFTVEELHRLIEDCRTSGSSEFKRARDEALIRMIAQPHLDADEILKLKVSEPLGMYLPPDVQKALDAYVAVRDTHKEASSDALWIGEQGPITMSAVGSMIRQRCNNVGIEPVNHDLTRSDHTDRQAVEWQTTT